MQKQTSLPDEHVLVFPAGLMNEIGYFSGFSREIEPYLAKIIRSDRCFFIARKSAEQNPAYKQIIPYVLLRHEDRFFSYRRGKLLSEKRLHGNCSIGIGGHISTQDENLFTCAYEEALYREVNEEIRIDSGYSQRIAGLINDDSNDVGTVHFGVVHIFDLEKPQVSAREKSINEAQFVRIDDLVANINDYENWSKICIRELSGL